LQFGHDADIVKDELVPRVVEGALTDERETLAWSTAEYDIDFDIAQIGSVPDIVTANIYYACADCLGVGEIVFMGCTVDGVNFYRSRNVESCLLETQRQSAGTGK
jgi:hypothetical protein